VIAGMLGRQLPKVETMLRDAAGAVLVEAHDEWPTGDRRYLGETTITLPAAPPDTGKEVAHPELIPE
jgi:hypothetical protein